MEEACMYVCVCIHFFQPCRSLAPGSSFCSVIALDIELGFGSSAEKKGLSPVNGTSVCVRFCLCCCDK